MSKNSLFDEDEQDAEPREPGESERCTPARLLAFIRETRQRSGKSPTLRDLKDRFGGILGPLVDAWTLQKQGLI